jgi:hypothetical protein
MGHGVPSCDVWQCGTAACSWQPAGVAADADWCAMQHARGTSVDSDVTWKTIQAADRRRRRWRTAAIDLKPD